MSAPTAISDEVIPNEAPQPPDIDAAQLDPDRLLVRGVDLLDLMHELTYVEAVFHVIFDRRPTRSELNHFDGYLISALRRHAAGSSAYAGSRLKPEYACISALASYIPDDAAAHESLRVARAAGLNLVGEIPAGLDCFTLIPLVLSSNVLAKEMRSSSFTASVLEMISARWDGSEKSAKLFDVLLVALHGGFGSVAPSILLPRFSASTFAPIQLNLIAGMTASGPAHLGACSQAMHIMEELRQQQRQDIDNYIQKLIENGMKIPGFGHPLFMEDPRTEALENFVRQMGPCGQAFESYLAMKEVMWRLAELRPNIDAISAAILLDLGVHRTLGTALFLFARTPTMIAHALQKKERPPFGQTRATARENFSRFPKSWV